MSEPLNQDLTKPTNNVEQFQDTGSVLRKVNFPIDTDGLPMLTGDGRALVNLPAVSLAYVTFTGVASGNSFMGIGINDYLIMSQHGETGGAPASGDVLPAPYNTALFIDSSGLSQNRVTVDGGANYDFA
jgi:hypothetical protein